MKTRSWRIGTRLLVAQALVTLAAIATAGLIAVIVGPPLFHRHMLEADRSPGTSELEHVERAFRTANLISLGIAVAIAAVLALAVSWYVTRRLQAPLTALGRAAARVAHGDYDTRVAVRDVGPELEALAESFNTMATRLAATEETRRRLLADLAHELRTPIATLRAYLEGVDDGVRSWDETTRGVLSDQVVRLARLAEDLDAVSRAEEGRLVLSRDAVPVEELLRSATDAVAGRFDDKRVRLEVHSRDSIELLVDRTRFLQVLTNLLDNARRHSSAGGVVIIDTDTVGASLDISVTDTGDGIPDTHLPHVFERFYRGDSARNHDEQGSGIGLTISRAIVEAHGGHLTAASDGPGRGATFIIRMPMFRPGS